MLLDPGSIGLEGSQPRHRERLTSVGGAALSNPWLLIGERGPRTAEIHGMGMGEVSIVEVRFDELMSNSPSAEGSCPLCRLQKADGTRRQSVSTCLLLLA